MISWICSESTTRPSFCISSADASRVACASSLRLAIRSSTDRPPMIERRWPWKTWRTRSCICDDAPLGRVLVVQEPGGGVGDRVLVVADLEDRDPADPDGDLLRVHAFDVQD